MDVDPSCLPHRPQPPRCAPSVLRCAGGLYDAPTCAAGSILRSSRRSRFSLNTNQNDVSVDNGTVAWRRMSERCFANEGFKLQRTTNTGEKIGATVIVGAARKRPRSVGHWLPWRGDQGRQTPGPFGRRVGRRSTAASTATSCASAQDARRRLPSCTGTSPSSAGWFRRPACGDLRQGCCWRVRAKPHESVRSRSRRAGEAAARRTAAAARRSHGCSVTMQQLLPTRCGRGRSGSGVEVADDQRDDGVLEPYSDNLDPLSRSRGSGPGAGR